MGGSGAMHHAKLMTFDFCQRAMSLLRAWPCWTRSWARASVSPELFLSSPFAPAIALTVIRFRDLNVHVALQDGRSMA